MAWRGLCLATAMVAGGESVGAQRLWSIEDVSTRIPPVVLQGVAVSPAIAAGTGASTVQTATIRVEFDYLRLGMGYLELPLANGAVIAAENAVFEDRGNGNLMWTGEVPGAGYASVLFTVQDGHLVGWFGAPGGPKHTVHAGPDGRGSFSIETGPVGDWCRAEAGPRGDEVRGAAATAHRLEPAVSGSNGGSLDILLLYSEGTARWWRDIGGPAVGVQQLADYLNMVFRNGAVPATANLIPVEWTPERSPHPDTKGGHYLWNGFAENWHHEFEFSPTVEALKRRHKPDLVHFIASIPDGNTVGVAQVLTTTLDPAVLTGWSLPLPDTFAHEIGHNLGGHHEPATFGDGFASAQQGSLRPHAFGHTDLTSCGDPHYDYGELLACPTTIMSYGQETWADPQLFSITEPFYSSVRHKPNGWTIGVAGEREVERLLHETVPLSMRNSEAPLRFPRFPREMTVHWSGRDAASLSWEGAFDSWEGAPGDVWNGVCSAWAGGSREICQSVGGRTETVTVTGLRPGGRHRFWFKRQEAFLVGEFTVEDYYGPAIVELAPPDFNGRAPAAPTDVSLIAAGPDGVRLGWRGESPAGGFEIWCRKWSSAGFPDFPSLAWERCGPPLGPGARSAEIDGLVAEEDLRITEDGATTPRGRYSFVVVAQNDSGFSASETIDYEFMPGPFPPPTAAGVVPDCALRSSGLTLDGRMVMACVETPAGERRRAWSYELGSDRSGLLYFFDRDNVELLVKVLDGCAINGHHWVFVAPVTDLGFRLRITNPGGWYGTARPAHWSYDFERRPNREILWDRVGNPKGATARTVSDTTAFPCTEADVAEARAADPASGHAGLRPLRADSETDCEPGGSALTLAGGYKVRMCYETHAGRTGEALDYGLDSSRSGLLYFFERGNVEALVKVLDGCGVNGHFWVFVAPLTDLAFNLVVESPRGERWTHRNALGRVAEAASDVTAFPCG